MTSLKYFNEDAPQYQIICAGSLLGVALHQGTSFPVGKVEFLDLYPLSLFEFMIAMNKEQYVELIQKVTSIWPPPLNRIISTCSSTTTM